MIDYNQIAAFIAVADAGTFTGGADAIGIPKGSISRKISLLEKSLDVRLFHRTTRKVTLTDIGKTYYNQCRPAFDQLDAVNNLIDDVVARPRGILRIAAPAAFGSGPFAQWVATYLDLYPDMRIEILLSDEFVDLVEQRIDIAFRFGELPDSTLIARKLATVRRIMCASPDYLDIMGTPQSAEDLINHDAIVHGSSLNENRWVVYDNQGNQRRIPIRPRMAVKSMKMVTSAALSGLGITLVPQSIVIKKIATGKLVQILPQYATPSQGYYIVYASAHQLSLNIKAFLELVEQEKIDTD